eukprot:jgi/Galph1/1202/GphlegSOOS_G6055.1
MLPVTRYTKPIHYTFTVFALLIALVAVCYPYYFWNNNGTVEWIREQYCIDVSCVPRRITSWRELFFLSHSSSIPKFPEGLSGWKLRIKDLTEGVKNQTQFVSIEEIVSNLPVREKEFTLICIGATDTWSAIGNAIWTGVTLVEILQLRSFRWSKACQEVQFKGKDGYIASLPPEALDKVWMVWKMNGNWLSPEHGFPVRIIAPSYYGTKNVKWLESIEFVSKAEHHVDIFELQGWPTDHQIRPVSFIHYPGQFSRITRPRKGPNIFRVTGVAYCGSDAVARVFVAYKQNLSREKITKGPLTQLENVTWTPAEAIEKGSSDIWSLWILDYPYYLEKGLYQLFSKVQCVSGRATNDSWVNDMGGWWGLGSTTFEIY